MSGPDEAPLLRRSPLEPTPPPRWPPIPTGAALTVVKRDPAGAEVARYPGTVLAAPAPPPWIALGASWTSRPVALNGLRFVPGDDLVEYFSPAHPFNAFAVFAPGGALRGWYANVTYPAWLDAADVPPVLTWHDLFVDVVALPDGRVVVRDEDELAAAGVASADPPLCAMILRVRDQILGLVARRHFPFDAPSGRTPYGGPTSLDRASSGDESDSRGFDVYPH